MMLLQALHAPGQSRCIWAGALGCAEMICRYGKVRSPAVVMTAHGNPETGGWLRWNFRTAAVVGEVCVFNNPDRGVERIFCCSIVFGSYPPHTHSPVCTHPILPHYDVVACMFQSTPRPFSVPLHAQFWCETEQKQLCTKGPDVLSSDSSSLSRVRRFF